MGENILRNSTIDQKVLKTKPGIPITHDNMLQEVIDTKKMKEVGNSCESNLYLYLMRYKETCLCHQKERVISIYTGREHHRGWKECFLGNIFIFSRCCGR